jgi:transposase InsO family protein
LYYKPRVNHAKQTIKNHITKAFEEIPSYGEKKVLLQLLEDGHKVSLNTIARYHQELGLQAVLAVKQVNTTMPIKEHAQSLATQWMWAYNNVRPHSSIGGIPPRKLLEAI